jgi:hypothetical protein
MRLRSTYSSSGNNIPMLKDDFHTSGMSTKEKQEKRSYEVKQQKVIKKEALNALLKLRASNGGNAKYGDIPLIVRKFHRMGYKYITRSALVYMLAEPDRVDRPVLVIDTNPEASNVSSLTKVELVMDKNSYMQHESSNDLHSHTSSREILDNVSIPRMGGRPRGSTDSAKSDLLTSKDDAMTEAAKRLKLAQIIASMRGTKCVPQGTLKSIIDPVEIKYDLPDGIISSFTVTNRVRNTNLIGESHQCVSPLHEIEPLVLEFCPQLARIGSPLDKHQLLSLVQSMIQGTIHADRMSIFKFNRHLELVSVGILASWKEIVTRLEEMLVKFVT